MLTCYLTENAAWSQSGLLIPKRVVWHSTGANNPYLKRYVQPAKSDPNYNSLMAKLGYNQNLNDWNHYYVDYSQKRLACVHAFIGRLANGEVETVRTLPDNKRAWGVGQGWLGSWNTDALQFEICEDTLTDKSYFNEVVNEAVNLTADWCIKYNIPYNMVFDHKESAAAGYGCNHGDISHWLHAFGLTMNDIREKVRKRIEEVKPMTAEEKKAFNDLKALVEKLQNEIKTLNSNMDPIYKTEKDIPSWGKDTYKKLHDDGTLKGASKSDLHLRESTLKGFVINDRHGLYDSKDS